MERSSRKFLERRKATKLLMRTILWHLENLLKIYHGIIEHQHLIDPKQVALLKAVRRVKEGTSAVLLQSGLDERWWADSMEWYCYLRMSKISWQTGKLRMKDDWKNRSQGQ